MKEVFRATDTATGESVAIAMLREFDEERFLNEVALTRRVNSTYVARVLKGFVEEGRAFVVSELEMASGKGTSAAT
jgi:serine/threonine protein kinase